VNRRSIRFRLTSWYAGILVLTFAAVGIGVWVEIRDSINDTVDKELRFRLQAMRDYLHRQDSGDQGPLMDLFEDVAFAPMGTRFRIADAAGHWLYQSPGTAGWNAPRTPAGALPKRGRVETVNVGGKPIRVLSAAAAPFVVQIGSPVDEFAEMLDAFTWAALLASPVLLLLASAGGYWMSRRALSPVERIARTASEIEARNLSERLPVPGTRDELDHLSQTLNAMLGRLEDSFRRVTQFTADASHELRTPIAIIRTTAEVTRRKPRTEKEYQEALDRILAESERTTGLLEDLMLLARADAGAADMSAEPVALAEVMQTACADVGILAEKAGITMKIEWSEPCVVSGDRQALRRLLLILLDNAIKYSRPAGEVRVHLATAQCNGRTVAVIEVKDGGVGISPEDLPHLFDRFYRASKDRSRKVDGVGLGLSIAQSIVRGHGGEIQVESKPGAGSTVRVQLHTI
jgi:heavy metal sensor kinase